MWSCGKILSTRQGRGVNKKTEKGIFYVSGEGSAHSTFVMSYKTEEHMGSASEMMLFPGTLYTLAS